MRFALHEAALKVAFRTRANEPLSWARKGRQTRQPAAHSGHNCGGVEQLTCARQ